LKSIVLVLVFSLFAFAKVERSAWSYEIQTVSPVLEMVDADLRRMYPDLKRYEIREITSAALSNKKVQQKLKKISGVDFGKDLDSTNLSRTLYVAFDSDDRFIGIAFGMAHRLPSGIIQLFLATKGSSVGPLKIDSLFFQRSASPNVAILKAPGYLSQFKQFSTHRVPERAWVRPPLHVERKRLDKEVLEDHHAFVRAVRKTLGWLQVIRGLNG